MAESKSRTLSVDFSVIYYFRKLHIFAAKDNKLPQTAVYLQ